VDKYLATIYPGNEQKVVENIQSVPLSVSFTGLEGGSESGSPVEYIITVSAVVSNAKMKGARRKFYLPPFPPQVENK
jgi:hypothetical protein